jgi:hypothetical protein
MHSIRYSIFKHALPCCLSQALTKAGGYLPSASVLARSEFLLPMDDDTTELFRNALAT